MHISNTVQVTQSVYPSLERTGQVPSYLHSCMHRALSLNSICLLALIHQAKIPLVNYYTRLFYTEGKERRESHILIWQSLSIQMKSLPLGNMQPSARMEGLIYIHSVSQSLTKSPQDHIICYSFEIQRA